jgi:hypothetical protein
MFCAVAELDVQQRVNVMTSLVKRSSRVLVSAKPPNYRGSELVSKDIQMR